MIAAVRPIAPAAESRRPARDIDDAIAAARYASLRRQIPLMYPALLLNILLITYANTGGMPDAEAAIPPGFLCLLILYRIVWWVRAPADAPIAAMRSATTTNARLCTVFTATMTIWSVFLLRYIEGPNSAAIALLLFLSIACCAFALQSSPGAWKRLIISGGCPTAAITIFSGEPFLMALGANLFLVLYFIYRNLDRHSSGLVELVTSRETLVVERERARAAEALAQDLAYRDFLTGLPNRRALTDDLAATVAIPGNGALLLIDLDGFKRVNDSCGHPSGDRLLQEVADRLRQAAGPDDRLYRLGGDEFAAILTGAAFGARAVLLARRIVATVAVPFACGEGHDHRVGASVGMALHPRDGQTADALLRRADIALYAAKGTGRGRLVRFRMPMEAAA